MNGQEAIILPIYFISLFGFLIWLVWYFLQRKKVNCKFELQNKLLDKFNSVEDLQSFFNDEAGKSFLKSLNFSGSGPREKLITSISTGVITGFLGVALLILEILTEVDYPLFLGAGVIVLAISSGFICTTFIAYKLSKNWGMIDK